MARKFQCISNLKNKLLSRWEKVWRVLIVDDHPVVREGIRIWLTSRPEVMLVGEGTNGSEAIKLVKETKPDVVLLDLSMPGMSGLEALPGIRRVRPETRVIIFTYHNTREKLQDSLAAHVDGFLLKDSSPTEQIEAIRSVMAGRFFVSSAAARHLEKARGGKMNPRFGLAPREYEYLTLASRGDRPTQIANAMGCSGATIRTYRKAVLKKLKLRDMAGLTRFALQNGL